MLLLISVTGLKKILLAVAPTLIQLVAPRIGVNPERLRPIDAISNVEEPLLLIAGTEDRYTRIDEARVSRLIAEHDPLKPAL